MARSKFEIFDNDLRRLLKEFPQAFNKNFGTFLGVQIRDEIRDLTSKGISPILGNGRFPGYKSVTESNRLKKQATSQRRLTKGLLKKSTKQRLRKSARENTALASKISKGYPLSVKNKFPGKKTRPVNLRLSEDFIDSLKYMVQGVNNNFKLAVGFFNKLSVDKEMGHRVGVNGQPSRPIIPINQERLAVSIQKLIFESFKRQIKNYIKKKKA